MKSPPGGRIRGNAEIVGYLNVNISNSYNMVELYFSSSVKMCVGTTLNILKKSPSGGRRVGNTEIVGYLNVNINDSYHMVELYFSPTVK